MTRLILESGDYYLERNFVILRGMVRVDELEKAPLKSWRPACYNYSELVEGCGQIPFTDKPQCKECPFRNLE